MNHLKHYVRLMRKAEKRAWTKKNAPCYVEGHHIFPQGIFGKNKRRVYLTAREHYIAHALLSMALRKRYGAKHVWAVKMARAFWGMSNQWNSYQKRYVSSKLYEVAKNIFSETNSGEGNSMFGRTISQKHKKAVREANLGKTVSEETRKKLRENHTRPWTGRHLSEEHKKKIGEKSGRGRRGKTNSEESKRLVGEYQRNARVTCPHCGKSTNPGNYTRWHGDNCKYKKD